MKSVIVDDIAFDNGPWLHMSPEGLDLLQVCCVLPHAACPLCVGAHLSCSTIF